MIATWNASLSAETLQERVYRTALHLVDNWPNFLAFFRLQSIAEIRSEYGGFWMLTRIWPVLLFVLAFYPILFASLRIMANLLFGARRSLYPDLLLGLAVGVFVNLGVLIERYFEEYRGKNLPVAFVFALVAVFAVVSIAWPVMR